MKSKAEQKVGCLIRKIPIFILSVLIPVQVWESLSEYDLLHLSGCKLQ